ncbi:MAG: glycosyltransferase [Tepidanaerobacteraceae bacterium]|nr:glycosyltransferase [Tepidanaerobacteraceae bacterium]
MYRFLIFIAAALISYAFTPAFIDMFEQGGRLIKNYKGEMKPQGIGIMFPFYSLLWYILYILTVKDHSADILLIQFAITAACLIGFIDDMLGARDVLGFKGHFRNLFKGRLTTGALKAIVGLLVAFIISLFLTSNLLETVTNMLIIALFTNFFNLLDLRPGRAVKVYIFAFLVILANLIITHKTTAVFPFIPLVGSIIGYMPYDLKARCMMGDAGSNVLGISIGFLVVLTFSWHIKIAVLAFLIGIHIFTEKYSLTDLIKNNRFLNYLDNLGRL